MNASALEDQIRRLRRDAERHDLAVLELCQERDRARRERDSAIERAKVAEGHIETLGYQIEALDDEMASLRDELSTLRWPAGEGEEIAGVVFVVWCSQDGSYLTSFEEPSQMWSSSINEARAFATMELALQSVRDHDQEAICDLAVRRRLAEGVANMEALVEHAKGNA